MTSAEALLRINAMFSHGETLAWDPKLNFTADGVSLRGPGVNVSWPSAETCLFGKDERISMKYLKYTTLFEMVSRSWTYYDDVREFADRNQWLGAYAGCGSLEELELRMSVSGAR